MKLIRSDRTLSSYWEHLVFLEAMLLARHETKALSAPVTAVLGKIEGLMQRDLNVTRGKIQARASSVVVGGDIEDEVTNVRSEILYFTKQDRKAPAYTTLFKDALSKMLKRALTGQLDVTQSIIQKLSLSLYPSDLSRKLITNLETTVSKAKDALQNVDASNFEATKLRLETQATKEEANNVRLSVYGELLKIATAKKRPKIWVERFFDSNFGESSTAQPTTSDDPSTPSPSPSDDPPQS